jgi:hypothetical protein
MLSLSFGRETRFLCVISGHRHFALSKIDDSRQTISHLYRAYLYLQNSTGICS